MQLLLEQVRDGSKSDIEILALAGRARRLSEKIDNDSLINQSLRYIALYNYKLENFNLFKKTSKEFLQYSTKLNDSAGIARANRYLGEYYLKKFKSDSAYFYYYNAEKIYRQANDDENLVKILSKVARIQKDEKDFGGSEVTTIEVIELLEPSDDYERLSIAYNNLGIIYNELGQYDEAINYHEKSLSFKKKFEERNIPKEEGSYNNLAVVYKNAKQYDKALENFNQILKNKELINERPDFYALVLDNYAHTKFILNQTDELPGLFFDALKFSKEYDKITINKHLSEYYQNINQTDSAKHYAYSANNIAKNFHNDDYLKTLLHLSSIEEDSLSVKFYKEYITLNDSLQNNERAIRNKFARIRYETKEIEQKNEQITKERLYLLILSIGLLLTIFLTYSVISQRA
ncbi:MAG: tetratricopeptide repeat protein, partial [Arcobacter sp.]|nr:tetratricopeptide repeat protein [Arcobacter sp.]